MTTPLQQLGEHGQSVWLDFISRELVTTGQLQHRVADESVTGLTSNPTIFQKAIAEGYALRRSDSRADRLGDRRSQ